MITSGREAPSESLSKYCSAVARQKAVTRHFQENKIFHERQKRVLVSSRGIKHKCMSKWIPSGRSRQAEFKYMIKITLIPIGKLGNQKSVFPCGKLIHSCKNLSGKNDSGRKNAVTGNVHSFYFQEKRRIVIFIHIFLSSRKRLKKVHH